MQVRMNKELSDKIKALEGEKAELLKKKFAREDIPRESSGQI